MSKSMSMEPGEVKLSCDGIQLSIAGETMNIIPKVLQLSLKIEFCQIGKRATRGSDLGTVLD